MTAPKPGPLRPIDVTCPTCWAIPGEQCYAGHRYRIRKPHAARIRAAAQKAREEGKRG